MSSQSKVPIQGPDKLLYLFQTRITQWKEMLFFLSWTPTLLWSLPRLDFLSQWKSQKAPASTQGWDGSLAQLVGRVWEPWLWTALLLPEPGIKATFRAGGKKSKKSQATHLGLTMVLRVQISGFFLLWNYPFSEKPCLCAACNIFQVYLEKGKGGENQNTETLEMQSYLRWWHTTQLPPSQVLQPCANNDSQHSHYTVSLIYVFSSSRPGCQKQGEKEG